MKISEVGGERAVIELIKELAGPKSGIGDDCAVIEPHKRKTVVTADLLVEGVHFRADWATYYEIGAKAAAVNLSDIAAMGGDPSHTFISAALPDTEFDDLRELVRGMCETFTRYGSVIAGGDTTASKSGLVINITQTGYCDKPVLRSGAEVGDYVMVTGPLGASRAGLELLARFGRKKAEEISPRCVKAHITPTPKIAEGLFLAKSGVVTAMMDISDGLASDAKRICEESGVGMEIYPEKLPISDCLREAAGYLGLSEEKIALAGGEDYELLFTTPKPEEVAEVAVVIGRVVEGSEPLTVTGGEKTKPTGTWTHF
ncbi:MAG: thiamine-phosphate kinase [Abditibacteriota bacterium]|nr:thiamine-phosphate kinase [Abditibacteriota bacterium]